MPDEYREVPDEVTPALLRQSSQNVVLSGVSAGGGASDRLTSVWESLKTTSKGVVMRQLPSARWRSSRERTSRASLSPDGTAGSRQSGGGGNGVKSDDEETMDLNDFLS